LEQGLKEKEEICFKCRQKDKWKSDHKNKEPLLVCEHDDVEKKIREAAEIRDDARVKMDIQDKDLKAIEIRYHLSCYSTYTNNRQLKLLQENIDAKPLNEAHNAAFESISSIIDSEVLEKNEVIGMSYLWETYNEYLERDNVAAAHGHMHKLKNKIQKRYNDTVRFCQPSSRQTEFLYNSKLEVSNVLKQILSKTEKSTIEEKDNPALQNDNLDTNMNKDVYHCGTLLHNIIKDLQETMPWPPSPEDISHDKIQVPDLLYNLLAYIFDGSSKPVFEGRLPVSSDADRLILSVAQDIINIARKGRIKTVKNVGLAVALRNLTGNKVVLTLLNRFGHTLSYFKIQEFEKALVKKYHGEYQGSLILPSTIEKNIFSTFVWDNNDLCEETLSGAGTTHVTNGIVIQQGVCSPNF
jgi:hypothetical protein